MGKPKLPQWRQVRLQELVAEGLSDRAIAERLGLSKWTIFKWRRRLGLTHPNGRRRESDAIVPGDV